jgi:hypothetical protein
MTYLVYGFFLISVLISDLILSSRTAYLVTLGIVSTFVGETLDSLAGEEYFCGDDVLYLTTYKGSAFWDGAARVKVSVSKLYL